MTSGRTAGVCQTLWLIIILSHLLANSNLVVNGCNCPHQQAAPPPPPMITGRSQQQIMDEQEVTVCTDYETPEVVAPRIMPRMRISSPATQYSPSAPLPPLPRAPTPPPVQQQPPPPPPPPPQSMVLNCVPCQMPMPITARPPPTTVMLPEPILRPISPRLYQPPPSPPATTRHRVCKKVKVPMVRRPVIQQPAPTNSKTIVITLEDDNSVVQPRIQPRIQCADHKSEDCPCDSIAR